MTKRALILAALGACSALLGSPASATSIDFAVQSLGGNSWQYQYTVRNDSLVTPIQEFSIYFEPGLYANLAVGTSPSGWDSLVAQPDGDIPASGFFDALALAGGIAPDAGLAGFAVTFDYLGAGTPGPQAFEVVNPVSFAVLSSGNTALVPAPGGAWLLGTAMLAVAARVRGRIQAG